jgi:hypothetical protein
MLKKTLKSLRKSTVVVSSDSLSPTLSNSSAKKIPENSEVDPEAVDEDIQMSYIYD